MAFLILIALNWIYLPWYFALPVQVILHLWFFIKTWTEYLAVMNLKHNYDHMPPNAQRLGKLVALNGVMDDVLFRITEGPLLIIGASPLPRNKHDLLMTGLLKQTKKNNPIGSRKYRRADYLCSEWLDPNDSSRDHC